MLHVFAVTAPRLSLTEAALDSPSRVETSGLIFLQIGLHGRAGSWRPLNCASEGETRVFRGLASLAVGEWVEDK